MYKPRLYEPGQLSYRLRYAITTILRDRFADEGAFHICFEMEDGDEVIRRILLLGLKNPKLRTSLRSSHLVNLQEWLARHPELSERYYGSDS